MTEEVLIKESGYDQKQFIQIRLHEILLRYDRANINPLIYDFNFQCFNYNIMFNSLFSIYNTIGSKLRKEEKEKCLEQLEELSDVMKLKVHVNRNGRTILINENYSKIFSCLFKTRNLFEDYMDSHGFNPSKDDVSKSILKF